MFGNFEFCSTRTFSFLLIQHFICSRWETSDITEKQDATSTEEFPRREVTKDEDDQRTVHGEPGVVV